MPLNSLGLGFVFTARDMASGTINNLTRNFAGMDAAALRSNAAYQRNFAVMGVGLGIMAAGAVELAGAFALADLAGEFEQGIARVGAISNASAEDLQRLHDRAIEVGIATSFSPTQATAGLEALASAGFHASESIALIMPAAQLAEGGGIQIEQAAETMASAMHVFGASIRDPADAVDQMLAISNATALRAADLELAIGGVARGASVTGQSLTEMLIAMGLVRDTGVEASVASQSVSSALTHISGQRAEFQALGVSITDASGQFRPFLDIVEETTGALGDRYANQADRAAAATELFSRFGLQAYTAIGTRLSQGVEDATGHIVTGTAAVAALREEMQRAAETNAAEEFQRRMLDTFAGQRTLLHGSLETLGIVVGEGFITGFRPIVELILGGVNRTIAFFQGIPRAARGVMAQFAISMGIGMVAVGGFLAVAAGIALLAPFMGAIATAAANLALALTPFVALTAGLVFVGVALRDLIQRDIGGLGTEVAATFAQVHLAFEGIVQLFTDGAFSGAVMEEMDRAGNSGIRRFVIEIFQLGFRVMQFFRGVREGFAAATDRIGPTVISMLGAFRRLGAAFGFIDEGLDAIVSGSSIGFLDTGARMGVWLGGFIERVVMGITTLTNFFTSIVEGARHALAVAQPGFDLLERTFGGVIDQLGHLSASMANLDPAAPADEAVDGWTRFGQVLGVVATAFGIIGFVVEALVWFFSEAIDMIRWIGVNGLALIGVFGDGLMNIVDGASLLGLNLERAIGTMTGTITHTEEDTLNRGIAYREGRIADRSARPTEFISPAQLAADDAAAHEEATRGARAESDARGHDALDRVAGLLERQVADRGPFEVTVQVDRETLARSTVAGRRSGASAAFHASSTDIGDE